MLAWELPVRLRTHSALLQALVKILDDISNDKMRSLAIPTGVPLIYELNDDLKPVRHYHVGYAAVPSRNAHEYDCTNVNTNMTVNMHLDPNKFEYDLHGQHGFSV